VRIWAEVYVIAHLWSARKTCAIKWGGSAKQRVSTAPKTSCLFGSAVGDFKSGAEGRDVCAIFLLAAQSPDLTASVSSDSTHNPVWFHNNDHPDAGQSSNKAA
jgi:hypothetical protein